jgi:hypothetical protein
MRRRNTGNYEPYNTNNAENHCIPAKYVTRWCVERGRAWAMVSGAG